MKLTIPTIMRLCLASGLLCGPAWADDIGTARISKPRTQATHVEQAGFYDPVGDADDAMEEAAETVFGAPMPRAYGVPARNASQETLLPSNNTPTPPYTTHDCQASRQKCYCKACREQRKEYHAAAKQCKKMNKRAEKMEEEICEGGKKGFSKGFGWGKGCHGHGCYGGCYDGCGHHPMCDYFHCKFGYFIPSGNGGAGAPLFGCYSRVYPDNVNHFDGRDGQLYSAQGYGVPIAVPLAPTVGHTYNYGWGVPSSRLTPVSRLAPR